MSRRKKNKNKKGGNPRQQHHPHHPHHGHSHGQKKTFKGIVEVTKSGMAFVIVEGLTKDIMVKQKNLQTALDKDEVLVDVLKQAHNQGRMEGVITEILKRNKTEFTGTLQVSKNFAFLIPDKGLFMPDIYIPANSLGQAKSGDKAVVKIVAWGEKSRKPVGEILEILDASDSNDLAMKEILIESGFPLNFPKEVMAELEQLQENITETEVRNRKDVRKILTMTIDPVDAKDFDDAISIRPLKNGLYEIGVHIADVSHYVLPGTELDKEADKRATSVYLPDRVLPMLPEKISNELCSLRPHEDKLTFSAMFQMNESGEIKQHWIGRTLIHSDHRFTYEEVQEIIESGSGLYQKEILLLNKIAQTLRGQRFAHGAINFSSQEVRFKLDETGKPIGIVIKESKEAHQLIEEFMLLANKTIAAYVAKIRVNKQEVPFPYRVHDTPDPEKLKVFALFAGRFGYKFDLSGPETIAASFNNMLLNVQGRPEQPVLETLGIRTMAKAVYTVNNIGHYGLGFADYCHFTSPIRRYPDVLVHRVLAECLANDVKPDKQMEQKCKHSSEMERKAMDAERAGNKYKQVEYMQQFIGHTFEGVISGVAHFGFWVETMDTKCEGLISIHSLNKREDFQYNEGDYALVGQSTGRKFRIGQKVSIRVVAANLAKRQLDYDLEDELTGTVVAERAFKPTQREERREERHEGRKKKKDRQRAKPWQQEGAPKVSLSEPKPLPVVDQVVVETHVVPVTPGEITIDPAASATPQVTPSQMEEKTKAPVTAPEGVAPAESPAPVRKHARPVKQSPVAQSEPQPAPAKAAPKRTEVKTKAPGKATKTTATSVAEPAKKQPAARKAAVPEKTVKAKATKTTTAKKATAKPAPVKNAATKSAAASKKTASPKKAASTSSPVKKSVKATPVKKAATKSAAVTKKTVAPKRAASASSPVKKSVKATPVKKAATKSAAATKKTVAPKKAASTSSPVKKSVKVTPAKKATAKTAATKAATVKKAAKPVAKTVAPKKATKPASTVKKATPASKATAAKKAAPAKKTVKSVSSAKKTTKGPVKKKNKK
ncbi:ribonuclease R [Chitinophaga sp. 212800010-3]|uniref:ribonuclease R n=1 Tax=unclassified Chitinophaga TaxID=2619133 RepID=UPI002DEE6CCE|nr:hypothetical protein [Chitinophaga sp. 212800010-3]